MIFTDTVASLLNKCNLKQYYSEKMLVVVMTPQQRSCKIIFLQEILKIFNNDLCLFHLNILKLQFSFL